MKQNAGEYSKLPPRPLTKREQRTLDSGGGCNSLRKAIERKAAAYAAYVAAHTDAAPAAPAATIERPEDRREFRNLSKDDYRTSNHLLGSIAGFADLLATL